MGRTERIRTRKKGEPRPVKVDSNSDFIELCKWMSKNDWYPCAELCPAIFSNTGRGLMALAPIQSNDPIVCIPKKLLMTKSTVLKELPALQPLKLTAAEALTLYVLHCKVHNLQAAYLSMLPQEFSVGALCTNEEALLIPRFLHEKVSDSIKYLHDKYFKIEAIWKNLFDSSLTMDMFQWAWFAVNTRAVYFEEDPKQYGPENNLALAPYLDLLNHDPTASILAKFNPAKNCYEIRTLEKIPRFGQVFINYGPHDNVKLFIEYGFIVPKNVHNVVEFHEDFLKVISLATPIQGKKLSLIQQLANNKNLFCNRQGFSCDAEIVLTIQGLDYAQLKYISSPYELKPNHAHIKYFGIQLINSVLLELRQNVQTVTSKTLPNKTSSFSVAQDLTADMIDILVTCLSNYT